MSDEISEEDFLIHQGKRRSTIAIAKSLNVNYCTLVLWMIEHNYKFNFSRANIPFEKKAATLWLAGCTDKEIAEAMGISRDSITGWRHRRELSPNKKKDIETIK